jgi:hypothetical protein
VSASAGWKIWGYPPVKKGKKIDDTKKPTVLSPPFSSEKNAREFAETLKAKGYTVAKVEWYSPPVRS